MSGRPLTGLVDIQVKYPNESQRQSAPLHTSLAYASADDLRQLGIWVRSMDRIRQARTLHSPCPVVQLTGQFVYPPFAYVFGAEGFWQVVPTSAADHSRGVSLSTAP